MQHWNLAAPSREPREVEDNSSRDPMSVTLPSEVDLGVHQGAEGLQASLPYLDCVALSFLINESTASGHLCHLERAITSVLSRPTALMCSFERGGGGGGDGGGARRTELTVSLQEVDKARRLLNSVDRAFRPDYLAQALRDCASNIQALASPELRLVNLAVLGFEFLCLARFKSGRGHVPAVGEFCRAWRSAASNEDQMELIRVLAAFERSRVRKVLRTLKYFLESKYVSRTVFDDQVAQEVVGVLELLYYACLYGGDRDGLASTVYSQDAGLEVGCQRKDMLLEMQAQGMPISPVHVIFPKIPLGDFHCETIVEALEDQLYNEGFEEWRSDMSKFVITLDFDTRKDLFERIHDLEQTKRKPGIFRLRVSRDTALDDAIRILADTDPSDLGRDLIIQFEGERGRDSGGLSVEFFQTIAKQLMPPETVEDLDHCLQAGRPPLFRYLPGTYKCWVQNWTREPVDPRYRMVGILLGLAVYNKCQLPMPLPLVFYRKLMGGQGCFCEVYELDEELSKNLNRLLRYKKGDLEDVFCLTFSVGYLDERGQRRTWNLMENGDQVAVTQANKQHYVDLYADFLLNVSVSAPFEELRLGFWMVTEKTALKQLLNCDMHLAWCIHDLREEVTAKRLEGSVFMDVDDRVSSDFWDVVHKMSSDDLNRLVQFVTGFTYVSISIYTRYTQPIFTVRRDSCHHLHRLPTASTCNQVLYLPCYLNRKHLRDKLTIAIQYCVGFELD